MAPTDDDPDRAADGGDDVVVTQALRALRRSALRCRRARLMIEQRLSIEQGLSIEQQGAACVSAMCSASLTHGRELLDLPS